MRASAPLSWLSVVLSAAAVAQDCGLLARVDDVGAAMDDRIRAIGVPGDKAAARESKKLAKAQGKLDGVEGDNRRKDLKALGAALKQVVRSRTTDAAIAAEVDELVRAAACEVETDAALAADLVDTLRDAVLREKAARKLPKADALLAKAGTLATDDAVAAVKALLKADGLYAATVAKAEKLLRKELATPGPIPEGLRIRNDFLQGALRNESGEDVTILDFVWDVRLFANGAEFDRDRGRATATATTPLTEPVVPPYALGNLENYAPQLWWSLDTPSPGGNTQVDVTGTVIWITSAGTFEGAVDAFFIIP